MFGPFIEEFKKAPAATLAAYAAIASAVTLLFSSASLPLPDGDIPEGVGNEVPIRLVLVGVFTFALCFGAAQLLHVVKQVTTRYLASLVSAILVQCCVAALTRQLLAGHVTLTPQQYESSMGATAGKMFTRTVAKVAGADMDAYVFVLSALVAVTFIGITLGRWENDEEVGKNFEVVAAFGAVWAILVVLLGGSIMETVLRAGL